MWRVLVRVNYVTFDTVFCVVPSWDAAIEVKVSTENIPEDVLKRMRDGYTYFHARAKLGALFASELNLTEWELE